MELLWTIIIVMVTSCIDVGRAETYDGQKLARVQPKSQGNINYLHDMARRHKRQMSFWEYYYTHYTKYGGKGYGHLDIVATPRVFSLLVDTLVGRGVDYRTLSDDVEAHLDAYMREHFDLISKDYFTAYHPYSEMVTFMEEAVYRCRGRCELFKLGDSYEGRPIVGVRIGGSKAVNGMKNKIWIDGGFHAREWISHATAMFLIDSLISQYNQDTYVRELVDNYEWNIVPTVNPDGYNYTWTTDRNWRKTRRPNRRTKCVGTDPNRNFDHQYGLFASADPCSPKYRGPHAFSEPETRAVRDYMMSDERKGSWLVYMSLHSRGQFILLPWGYTKQPPSDYVEQERVARAMQKGIHDRHGVPYEVGSTSHILYQASGTSRDWARSVARIKYVTTIELRDKSESFILHPSNIVPVGEEIWAGVVQMMRAIESREPGIENELTFVTTTEATRHNRFRDWW